jgi:hypothetical protein
MTQPERRTLAGLFQWPKDGIRVTRPTRYGNPHKVADVGSNAEAVRLFRVTSTVWCSVVGILSALGSSGDASHAGSEDRVYSLSTSNRLGGWHPSMHARHCPRGSSFFMGNYPKNALFVAPTAATLFGGPTGRACLGPSAVPGRVTMKGALFGSF